MVSLGASHDTKRVEQERSIDLDASAQQNDLIAEVKLYPRVMKRRIEALIDR